MTNYFTKIYRAWRVFQIDEGGAGTGFALIWAIICIAVGGLAVDTSYVWAMESRLQATADIAAHSGIMVLVHPDRFDVGDTPESLALEVAELNMRTGDWGNVLISTDVLVGKWSTITNKMDTSSLAPDAVGVITKLDGVQSNVVPTFLLRIIGFDFWHVSTPAVFQRIIPDCTYDGLLAAGIVDMTSQNEFKNYFCIHGEEGVELNSNDFFEEGVSISMVDPTPYDEGGTFRELGNGNTGVEKALNPPTSLLPEAASANSVAGFLEQLKKPEGDIPRDYINDQNNLQVVDTDLNGTLDHVPYASAFDNVVPYTVPAAGGGTETVPGSYLIELDVHTPFEAAMLVPNAVNIIECGQGVSSKITFANNTLVEELVIVSDCPIEFGTDMQFINAIVATSSTDAMSLKGAEGVKLGRDDACTSGDGAQFVTAGGANFASGMEYYGSQLIATGDVHLAAAVEGIEGLSIQSYGDITITAGNSMGLCSGSVDTLLNQYWYRMVY